MALVVVVAGSIEVVIETMFVCDPVFVVLPGTLLSSCFDVSNFDNVAEILPTFVNCSVEEVT